LLKPVIRKEPDELGIMVGFPFHTTLPFNRYLGFMPPLYKVADV